MPTARHLKFLWIIRQRILKVICLLMGYVVQAFENFVIQEMFDKNIALLRKIIQLDWEQEIEI